MRPGRSLLAFLAGLCLAGAAPAVPARPEQPRPDPEADLAAETTAYGNWLGRLLAAEAPVEAQLTGLDPAWRAAFAEGGTGPQVAARLRPIIARALAEIDAANPNIDALERPRFSLLELDDDLQPAAMAHEVQTLNGQIRDAMAAFNPLIDAIANNDRAAAEAAGARVIASVSLVLETKVLLARAGLAATPRDDPSWYFGNADLIVNRVSARMYRAWRPMAPPRVDPSLPDDFDALAAEIDSNLEQGGRRIDAALVEYREELTSAERDGNRSGADIFRRVIAMYVMGRDYLQISHDLALLLRAEAQDAREHVMTRERVVAFFHRMQPIREHMAEVEQRVVAAMGSAQ